MIINFFSRFFFVALSILVSLKSFALHGEANGILIPFYIYPTQAQIQPLIDAKNANPDVPMRVILNPASGAGNFKDASYEIAIKSLQQAGIEVAGYVYTNYNQRPITEVAVEIGKWYAWYNPNGIFLDAMGSNLSYYQQLTDVIKILDMDFSIGNSGSIVDPSYANVVDTVVISTTSNIPDINLFSSWIAADIPKSKVAILAHSVPSFPIDFITQTKNFAGWIYVTDYGAVSDPWQSLSSYLTQLMTDVEPSLVGTIVPFYIYPTTAALQPLINAKLAHPQVPFRVILNPNSGPGAAIDPVYTSAVAKLKAAGISVVGYVSTSYGNRSLTTVRNEIKRWTTWYNPDGIFLDEMSLNHAFYQNLTAYAKNRGVEYVVGNPGSNIDISAADDVDNLIIFENASLPNLDQFSNWYGINSPYKISILNYNIPTLPESYIREAAQYFGWIYVTDDKGVNPWDKVPSYFSEFIELLDNL